MTLADKHLNFSLLTMFEHLFSSGYPIFDSWSENVTIYQAK